MDPAVSAYLDRVGLPTEVVSPPDADALARLQHAHVRSVPWETFAVAGDPYGPAAGEGVSLASEDLFEKLVARERGGFCYEHNALFAAVLDELGFDVSVRAAHMLDSGGNIGTPASHSALVVAVDDRRLLVDVGLGTPPMRRPTPLSGAEREDEAGVGWRVVASDRPDADVGTQYRRPGESTWNDRYVYRDVPREWGYFAAPCEYLTTAPESPFADSPTASLATPDGWVKLTADRLVERDGERRIERPVDESEWRERLRSTFGLAPFGDGDGNENVGDDG
ncbi:MAG: arylamine N-acetyltransferase [Halolamina sp.]